VTNEKARSSRALPRDPPPGLAPGIFAGAEFFDMKNNRLKLTALFLFGLMLHVRADDAQNPIIFADVPDMSFS
jgi:hypothetical protein